MHCFIFLYSELCETKNYYEQRLLYEERNKVIKSRNRVDSKRCKPPLLYPKKIEKKHVY